MIRIKVTGENLFSQKVGRRERRANRASTVNYRLCGRRSVFALYCHALICEVSETERHWGGCNGIIHVSYPSLAGKMLKVVSVGRDNLVRDCGGSVLCRIAGGCFLK